MQFQDELAAGVVLIRPALQSPDYVAGVSGWAIKIDGSAEFNNVTIRGDASSSNYVPGVSGWHLDDNGSAEFNDVTIRGTSGDSVIVGPSTGPQVRVGSNVNTGYIRFPTNRAIENDVSTLLAGPVNTGAANEYASLQFLGPTVDGAPSERAAISLNSQNNDGSSHANIAFIAGAGAVTYDEELITMDGPRLDVVPVASANSGLYVRTTTGHTGLLFRLDNITGSKFRVAVDGSIASDVEASAQAALNISTALAHTGPLLRIINDGVTGFNVDTSGALTVYGENTLRSFTPTVTGGGTATFTVQSGLWERVGKMIFVNIYLIVNAAGSGAAAVSVAAPTNVARSQRQVLHAHGGGLGGPGAGEYTCMSLTGGSGAVFDRLTRGGTDLTGANLSAGATISIEGWYREA